MSKQASDSFHEWRPIGALENGYPPPAVEGVRVVAIGNFDGAHRGHQAVVQAARALAGSLAGDRSTQVLALTFDPHPRQFFQPSKPHFRLLQPEARLEHLRLIGFDGAVVLPFTAEFAALAPETFIEEVLVQKLGIAGVVVGEDFHFGKGRAGTPKLLIAEGRRLGFAVRLVPPLRDPDGGVVSSTAIRNALGAGDLARAHALLGYDFAVSGQVIHGEKRGRELGYPTANIRLEPDFGLAHGVYAIRAVVDGARYGGVASFGRRPHFDNGAPLLEAHLFDFAGDLYGKTVEVTFLSYLRGEEKFDSLDALIAQMDADSAAARQLLKSKPR